MYVETLTFNMEMKNGQPYKPVLLNGH